MLTFAGATVEVGRVELRRKMPYQRQRLELSSAKRERTFIKLSLGILFAVIAFVAFCWTGRRAYVRWQETRLVVRGETALSVGDLRQASLAAQNVRQLKPDSARAARILAEVADRAADKPSAIEWRRKVVQVQPDSIQDWLALVQTALRFNDMAEVQRALSQLPPGANNDARYHVALALVAQQKHKDDEAKREWMEAVRLAPEESGYLFQLALTQIRSSDETEHASAVSLLERLRKDPKLQLAATRAMIQDAISRRESSQRIVALANDLRSYPESALSDRLTYLDILRQTDSGQFASYLSELEQAARDHPADLAGLLTWLSRNNLNLLALDFIKTVPPERLEDWPVPGALADIKIRLKDWRQLEGSLKNANWRQYDLFRHAYLARALRELDQPAGSAHEWAAAAKSATEGAETTWALMQLAGEWNWTPEAIDLLWALTKYPDRQTEALTTLYRYYAKEQDTQGLYRVLVRLSELNPDDLDIKNNLAQVGLLLDAQVEDARRLSAEIYHKQPKNPAYLTTYAYSLLTDGKKEKAVQILKELTPEQLSDPAISTYYGICLAAVKDPQAATYLKAADKAKLLPQEKALVERARASLR